jgi:hypothetical protein
VLIFFCDFFDVTTDAGKRLKQSHNRLQTIFEGILEFFTGPRKGPPNARLAAFPAVAVLAAHAANTPRKARKTHIHTPFSQ